MSKRRRRSSSMPMRFFRSVTAKLMLAIVVPSIALLCCTYYFVKGIAHNQIMQAGQYQLTRLKLHTAELLELEQLRFEDQARRFAMEPDFLNLLTGVDEAVGKIRLDELHREYELETIALLDCEGSIRSFFGVSPQMQLTRFPQKVLDALAEKTGTHFFLSQRGVALLTLLPVKQSDAVVGALLVTKSFALGSLYENALLLSDQGIQSQSFSAGFMVPFVPAGSHRTIEKSLVLSEGSFLFGSVALPGIDSDISNLMVGVNQRDFVVKSRCDLQRWIKGMSLLMLLFALGGMYYSRSLMGPVFRLIEAIKCSMNDEESVSWPPITRDEFGALNGAVRAMAERVRCSCKSTEESLAEAGRALSVKTDFLANISHELRTPLNGILGMTDMLMRTSLQEDQKTCIRNISSSSNQLVAVLGDIFDASRIESHALQLNRAEFDLGELLSDFKTITRMRTEEKGLTLACFFKEGTPVRVIGDRMRIRQVLSNLVDNAIKFTETGGLEIHVRSRPLYKGTAEFVFTVKDTGVGMEQRKVKSLFSAFEQADTSLSRRHGGLGLGLTITSKIVEKMSGKIAVLSEVGKGTSFSVMVPLSLPEVVSRKKEESTVALWKRVPMILVAEDNKMNQIVVRRILTNLGCKAVIAVNGVEAVDFFPKNDFDLVLMDCQMPEMDGYEATRKIHELQADMPIIALTAHSLDSDRQRSSEAGMVEHITKPINTEMMSQVLKQYLKGLLA